MHHLREQLYSLKKKKIYRSTNRKIDFHVSLKKHHSNLLKETNNYIKSDEHIKFCFLNSNGKLNVKFADNHNVSFDTFQSFLTVRKTLTKRVMKTIMLRQLRWISKRPVPFCLFVISI